MLLKNYGGVYINSPLILKEVLEQEKLSYAFCSSCSKTKSGREHAIPKDFYVSSRLLRFYRWCEYYNQPYGILSDKYGVRWMDEESEYYDIHPSSLSDRDFKVLGDRIRVKCKKRGVKTLIFYNNSPLMSRPYFKMLSYSLVKFYYITKLFHMINEKGGLGI